MFCVGPNRQSLLCTDQDALFQLTIIGEQVVEITCFSIQFNLGRELVDLVVLDLKMLEIHWFNISKHKIRNYTSPQKIQLTTSQYLQATLLVENLLE